MNYLIGFFLYILLLTGTLWLDQHNQDYVQPSTLQLLWWFCISLPIMFVVSVLSDELNEQKKLEDDVE